MNVCSCPAGALASLRKWISGVDRNKQSWRASAGSEVTNTQLSLTHIKMRLCLHQGICKNMYFIYIYFFIKCQLFKHGTSALIMEAKSFNFVQRNPAILYTNCMKHNFYKYIELWSFFIFNLTPSIIHSLLWKTHLVWVYALSTLVHR